MKQFLARCTAVLLILIVSSTTEPLFAQQSAAPQLPPPDTSQQKPATQSSPNTLPPLELPENPGRSAASQQNQQNQNQGAKPASRPTPQPSGTAVAPQVEVSGGAASKPAGVALAPPKQRQIRSLLIKFGFIAGAGIALGTVAALSAASPGRVPNSGH